jgi:hypothetical protein
MTAIAPDTDRAAGELLACLGLLVRRLRQVHVDGELTLSQTSVLVRLAGTKRPTVWLERSWRG